MVYLTKADFAQKVVTSSRILGPGGKVGTGTYTRRGKNVVSSPRLIARMKEAARQMDACKLNDACVPLGKPELVGRPVPGKPGKVYVDCTDEERVRRLENAVACARTNLRKA